MLYLILHIGNPALSEIQVDYKLRIFKLSLQHFGDFDANRSKSVIGNKNKQTIRDYKYIYHQLKGPALPVEKIIIFKKSIFFSLCRPHRLLMSVHKICQPIRSSRLAARGSIKTNVLFYYIDYIVYLFLKTIEKTIVFFFVFFL